MVKSGRGTAGVTSMGCRGPALHVSTGAMVWVRALVLCAAVLSVGRSASAAEDPEGLIREGVKLRREGNDARAEGYFRRAYQLAETPRTAAQYGLVELALGQFLEAEVRLSEALAAHDAWITEHRDALTKSLAQARQHLLCVELSAAPAKATYESGGISRVVPNDGVLCLAPGARSRLRVLAPGHDAVDFDVEGRAGDVRMIAFPSSSRQDPPRSDLASGADAKIITPPPLSPPPSVETGAPQVAPVSTDGPRRAGMSGSRIAGVVMAVAGVAAGITGGVLYAQGSAKLDEYRTAVENNRPWNPADEDWKTLQTTGVVGLALGGAAIAGGAALFFLAAPQSSTADAAVALIPGPRSAYVSYRGAF